MPATSNKQANTAKLAGAVKSGHFPASKAGPSVKSMAKMPMSKLKHFMKMKEHMTLEQKKKLLIGLHKLKEMCGYGNNGNVGGETDIVNSDNLDISENEFTSGDSQPASKVIAKTFDTKADFDSYVNQRRGIEMTPKEMQAVSVMAEAMMPPQQPQRPQPKQTPQSKPPVENPDETADDKIRVQKSNTFMDETQGADVLSNFLAELELNQEKPTHGDKFFLRYELTDDFGNNTTTIIKKLKEGNQFCWVAFSKYESPEEEGNPGGNDEEK